MKQLLHIEDNKLWSDLIHEMVCERFEDHVCETLSDGLAAYSSDKFDVVLLDLKLPDSYGKVDTIKTFLSIHPEAAIVASTGHPEVTRRDCIMAGARGFISKGLAVDSKRFQRELLNELDRAIHAVDFMRRVYAFRSESSA